MSKGFANDPRFAAIAITGGPSAGKSTLMARARQWLENRGLRVATLPEAATDLITSGFSPVELWNHPLAFQRYLLQHILEREERYYQMLSALATDRPLVLLCDRGALDAMAYVQRSVFLQVLESLDLNLHTLRERYRAVVHLVTAADGAREHYTLANNAARTETPEVAVELDRKTQAAWLGHQHMHVIDNSAQTFERKMERALRALARVLSMPEPLEKERKFLVTAFSSPGLPTPTVDVVIIQTYLRSEGDVERRVRMRRLDGVESYYYTKKKPTATVGVRNERERQITLRKYEHLLTERDTSMVTIEKVRRTFVHEGHHFELDIYKSPIHDLIILEVEVEDMTAEISLPPGMELTEVTGDATYSNASIAKGLLHGYSKVLAL